DGDGTYSKISYDIFFKAEDGIRYRNVTGVQTCALPIFNFKDKIVIERKADLNELCCNLFDKKDEEGLTRFERELKRGYEQGIKIHLLVETDNMVDKILSSKHFRSEERRVGKERRYR